MNRRISVIGSIVTSVLLVGTVGYGVQHNAVAASITTENAPLFETRMSRIVSVDTNISVSSTALSGTATDITSSTVTFHGIVYPHEGEVSYWFEYSADPNLGLILIKKTPRVSLITSSSQKSVQSNASGLMRSTKYYFRIVTQDSDGTVRSNRATFNTK